MILCAAISACVQPMEREARSALAKSSATFAEIPKQGSLGTGSTGDMSSVQSVSQLQSLEAGTVDAYQAYAFAHSPGLRASFERWRGAVEIIPSARALPDPTVTYAGFVAAVQTRGGPMRHKLGVRQWFPWPTSVSGRVAASTQQARASQRMFEAMGLWPDIVEASTPIRHIHVSDRGRFGFSHIDAEEQGVEALGYVVINRVLGGVLQAALAEAEGVDVLCPARITDVTLAADRAGAASHSSCEYTARYANAARSVPHRPRTQLPRNRWQRARGRSQYARRRRDHVLRSAARQLDLVRD